MSDFTIVTRDRDLNLPLQVKAVECRLKVWVRRQKAQSNKSAVQLYAVAKLRQLWGYLLALASAQQNTYFLTGVVQSFKENRENKGGKEGQAIFDQFLCGRLLTREV